MFCVDMDHFFLLTFFVFFMFTIFGIPDTERRKRNLLIGQPQGSLSESRNSHCFDLTFTFSCGLPTWRLIPDQFK